jgi:LacI family transcriptional regulator
MKRLQLEDLAKKLGFSKTLVSMVLNGKAKHYGISQKTETAVLDAAAELNFSPNKFAKALRTGKSNFIGLIVTDISNPFYSTITKSIENILSVAGYNLLVSSSDENEEKEKQLVEIMLGQQGVEGLIVVTTFKTASFYEQPRFSKTPIVFMDRILPLFKTNYVIIDNYGGSVEILVKLIKDGRKKIACFCITPLYLSTVEDRLNGYKDTVKKHNLQNDSELIKVINYETIYEDVEKALFELMQMDSAPDAIFMLNNHIAVAMLVLIKKREFVNYASKIQLACFDDIELFNIIDRPVISVSQPIQEIGKNASSMLLNIISAKQTSKSNLVLSTKLIER